MSERLRVGQAGLGYWGRNLARNFDDLTDLNWLCDASEERRAEVAERYPDTKVTADFDELLAADDVDAVVIATPVPTHYPLARAALEAGKHVFVEKPPAMRVAEMEELIALAEEHGLVLMPGHLLLYHPGVLKLKELIDTGELGDVLCVYGNRVNLGIVRSNENALWSLGVHDLSVILWLLGEEPVEVSAMASCLVDPAIGKAGDFDTLMVILTTGSGRQCHINNCRDCAYGYDQRLEVFGAAGMLLNDNLRPTTLRRYLVEETEAREPLLNFFLERYADAYRIELEGFVEAVESGNPMPVTVADGRQALRLADAALESAVSGQRVHI